MNNHASLVDQIVNAGLLLLKLLMLSALTSSISLAAIITFQLEGEITNVDSTLTQAFADGGRFTVTYTFDSQAPDDGNLFLGYPTFYDAINNISFASDHYTAYANNGDISEDFEDGNAYSASSTGALKGSSIGQFTPESFSVYWNFGPEWGLPANIDSGGPLEHPYFTPDISPILLCLYCSFYDADGNLVYEGYFGNIDIELLNQPLYDKNGLLVPAKENNGHLSFLFNNDDGQSAQIKGRLISAKVVPNPIESGLVAYWPMQEGFGNLAYDHSGHEHHGQLMNDLLWAGNDLSFPGEDQYIDAGFIDVPSEALSLAAWVKSEDFANCRYNGCRIITKSYHTSNPAQYWMISTVLMNNETHLRFSLKTNGETSHLYATGDDIKENEWMHVAAVYDGENMYLYKNGVEVGRLPKRGPVDVNSKVPVWIGGNPYYNYSRPWKGNIADVRVYQRALSESEVNMVKNHFTEKWVTFNYQGEIFSVDASLQDRFAVGDKFSGTFTFNPNEQSPVDMTYPFTTDRGIFDSAIKAATFDADDYSASGNQGGILQSFEDIGRSSPFYDDINQYSANPIVNKGPAIGDFSPAQIDLSWVIEDDGRWDYFRDGFDPFQLIVNPRFDPTIRPYRVLPDQELYDGDGKLVYNSLQQIVGNINQPLYTAEGEPVFNGDMAYEFWSTRDNAIASIRGRLRSVSVVKKHRTANELGLYAHWPLDGSTVYEYNAKVIDVSGHKRYALLHGPTYNYTVSALSFDGIDDYIDAGYINITGALTLTAWVSSNDLSNCPENGCRIIAKSSEAGNDAFSYWVLNTTKVGNQTRLSFTLRTLNSTSTLIASSGDLSEGELFHVAAVYDGDTMRLYKDGVEVGRMIKTGPIANNDNAPVWIGANHNSFETISHPWKGVIRDVRIFNKALTEEELKSNMACNQHENKGKDYCL